MLCPDERLQIRRAPSRAHAPPRLRPSDERAQLAETARTTRTIAMVAVVAALVALGLAAWRFVVPAGSSCQDTAWNTTPKAADLPAGWSISASQYDVDRKQMTVVGPTPADANSAQAVVYATITCFPSGAADAVTRSADAAKAAGQTVTARDDLGDQAFSATDPSNATFLQLRHGDVVVYLAASGDATPSEVDALASAFDKALGGDGGQVAVGTPDPGGRLGRAVGRRRVAVGRRRGDRQPGRADLEAAIPATVGDVALGVRSATGADVLGDDPGARAVAAALRAAGHQPEDLLVAYASDETAPRTSRSRPVGRRHGRKAMRDLALNAWLPGSGAGVTRTEARPSAGAT